VLSAVGSGREDDTAEHRDDGEHSREAGTADAAGRRQLFSKWFGEGRDGSY
jgi:hypothetical protein